MSGHKSSSDTELHHKLHCAYNLLEQKERERDSLLSASIERETKMVELKRQMAKLRLLVRQA